MLDILIYVTVIVLFLAGIALALVNLPGIWLIFIGLLIYAISTGFATISISTFWILLAISIVITFIDNLTMPLGAKKFGSSKWGMAGALIGGFIGTLTGGLIGLIAGPLIGAILFEVSFAKKDTDAAVQAGIGALIGFLTSVVLKFGGVVAMAVWGVVKMFGG